MSELPEKIPLFILDSNESPALFITHYTKWVVYLPSFPSFEWDLFIMDSPKGEDQIWGYVFLYHFNHIIDLKNGLITCDSSHQDSSSMKSSASNALATDVNSVALVGELKTPPLPSPFHIPSIMLSQSLLKLRDKGCWRRFRYNFTSCLSRGYEPSSLEEKWNEEEEPEEIKTVLKVVPPAYQQYFDVFYNVKAEKLPPHHASDHHIELEGLLPPIGVIYSL
ncbi:hypothetical protein O181_060232 [Austropuccinia psidii MF-1]|uniref:Uncharacterized protein n=1 Tax=Austropuccinia psidii MF-1 TaxID=1389203 RepID=A0A9Q3EN68_9BASI|nr:hypothetical protein [Austropuccinia psidii MF-1]